MIQLIKPLISIAQQRIWGLQCWKDHLMDRYLQTVLFLGKPDPGVIDFGNVYLVQPSHGAVMTLQGLVVNESVPGKLICI